MQHKTIICILFVLVLFVSVLFYGCVPQPENETELMNHTYIVRDIHIGYVNGASIIVVEYYDGNDIKIVDNKMIPTTWSGFRYNVIDIKRSESNESTLLQYERSTNYPTGRYILYLTNDKDISGIGSNYPRARKSDEETYIN